MFLLLHSKEYLHIGNTQDQTYEHIKDQACTEKATTLQEQVHPSRLRKYLSLIEERGI